MPESRIKPDFLIIGSMKCGTTTLHSDLSTLKGIHMPSDKEPSFLTKNDDISAIQNHYSRYFRSAHPDQLCGEASTDYTKLPIYKGVPEKAYAACGPHLKLIMILRDPIQRIYSHLRHNISGRLIKHDHINEAVLNDPSYAAISDYGMQLEPWVARFGKDNIFCISLHEYQKDRRGTILEIARFLDIETEGIKIDPENVKNKSVELLYTDNITAQLVNTRVYREIIRPLLSDRARAFTRNLLLRKAPITDIRLAESVERELESRLGNVENDVASVLGRRISIHGH